MKQKHYIADETVTALAGLLGISKERAKSLALGSFENYSLIDEALQNIIDYIEQGIIRPPLVEAGTQLKSMKGR